MHTITATYGGDGNFATSTSAAFTLTVNPADLLSAHNGSTNPTTENFGTLNVGSGPVGPVANDQGHPAWEITAPNTDNQVEYIDQRPLTSTQAAEIASAGFTETVVARVTRNNGNAPAWQDQSGVIQSGVIIGSISTDVLGSGSPRFDIDLAINSQGDTVVILPTSIALNAQGAVVATGLTDTLTDSGYHTYQLYYSPATNSASLYIDGKLALSGYTGETAYLGYTRLYWGTTGGGQGFYNQVKLEAGYDIE